MENTTQKIAQTLLNIQAVGFKLAEPITFKSGLKSPVYVDNRRLPFFPEEWTLVIEGFRELITLNSLDFDIIAGIETAGIPHSAALGFLLKKPSVFVRKQVKDHGTKKRVEGGQVEGKRVLLIEDHITTGGSSLSGVEALRAEGGIVTDCLAITSYEFPNSKTVFAEAGVQPHTLTSFAVILEEAVKSGAIPADALATVEDWFTEQKGWAGRHGF